MRRRQAPRALRRTQRDAQKILLLQSRVYWKMNTAPSRLFPPPFLKVPFLVCLDAFCLPLFLFCCFWLLYAVCYNHLQFAHTRKCNSHSKFGFDSHPRCCLTARIYIDSNLQPTHITDLIILLILEIDSPNRN